MKWSCLTSLSFGVHSPRRCHHRALLSDRDKQRFVIIVLREEPQQVDGRFGKAFQRILNILWDKNNPFSWGEESPTYRVVALEVEWRDIVGIDYRFPLHDDGKLVLEARAVVKRCFKTVEDARDFYSPRAADRPAAGPMRSSHSAAPTPSKMSLDGRHAMRPSASCAHLAAALSISPRLARPMSRSAADWTGVPLRHLASAESRSAIPSFGSDRPDGGRGGAAPRSVSATRARAVAGAAQAGCCSVGRCWGVASSTPAPRGRCVDYASADEGKGSNRHRWQPSVGGEEAPARDCGGSGGVSAAARRRLQLLAAEVSVCAGSARAATVGAARACHGFMDASPRKARSVNDLTGMDTAQAAARAAVTASSAAATVASQDAPIAEWYASAAAAALRAGAAQRTDVTGCWESSSTRGLSGLGSGRGGRGGSSRSIAVSSSVDSLQAAMVQQQHQHQQQQAVNEATVCRRRRGGGGRACRETKSWTQLVDSSQDRGGGSGGGNQARGGEGCGVEGASAQIPRASRFTQASATYNSNTLVLSFRDPLLIEELRCFVKKNIRLLKLYESGLPPWAVFMPCYGLPYRPWFRRAVWFLFIAISVFSMSCGFYDLYKNVPFLKQVITAVASRMYLPASEWFEWLERHTQIRMSILLTYLFSKSPLFVSLMRMLRSLAALLQQLLQPVASALSVALQPVLAAAQVVAASVGGGAAAAATAMWQTARPVVEAAALWGREAGALGAAVLGPPARALWALAVLLAQLVRLIAALVGMVLVGPLQLACSIGGMLSWVGAEVAEQLVAVGEAAMAALQWVLTLGRAARRAAPAMKAGVRLAAQAANSAAAAAGGGSGLSGGMAVWHWLGLEVVGAYNAVRLTFLQAFKSAQAVLNFCVTVAQTAVQHRVSLLLQLQGFLTRQKARLPPAVAASVPLPAFVSMPSFGSIPAFDIPLPGSDPDEDMDEGPVAAGLADPASSHQPMYDMHMDMDMVLLGSGEEERQLLASEQPSLYGGDGGVVDRCDGGGGLPEPIPIPPRGLSAGGLRRRHSHHRGAGAGGRLGTGHGGGGQLYGVYDMTRQRLDAVDEEMEDAQQLSDRDSMSSEARSTGCATRSGAGSYVGQGRRHLAGSNPWVSQGGHPGAWGGEEDDSDDVRYSSAPGGSNAMYGGGGNFYGQGFHSGVPQSAPLSSPSQRSAQGWDAASRWALSRSLPSAGEAAGMAASIGGTRNGQNQLQHQSHSREKQQQQKQQQQRCQARSLRRSASSPPGAASGASAAEGDAAARGGDAGKGQPAAKTGNAGAGAASLADAHDPASARSTSAAAEAEGGGAGSRGAAPTGVPGSANGGAKSTAVGAAAKPGTAGEDAARNKARGGGPGPDGAVGVNSACGRRRGVGGKHVGRQPAIQAA